MKPTPEHIEPVAWGWHDRHGCWYITMDRPDVEDVAATVGSSPMPLYDSTALAAAEERGRAASGARIAELEKRLADAEVVIEPLADRAFLHDGGV